MAANARMLCCFCGEGAGEVGPDDYVQLDIRFPEVHRPIEQSFGAHRDCLVRAVADGFTVEGPR